MTLKVHFFEFRLAFVVPRREPFKLLVTGLIRWALGEQVLKVQVNVNPVGLCRLNNGINQCACLRAARRVGEQPVLSAGHERLAASFAGVVAETATAVFKVSGKIRTPVAYVGQRLVQARSLYGSLYVEPLKECVKDGLLPFGAPFLYGIKSNALFLENLLLEGKELVDKGKSLYRGLRVVVLFPGGDRVDQVSPYVNLIPVLE